MIQRNQLEPPRVTRKTKPWKLFSNRLQESWHKPVAQNCQDLTKEQQTEHVQVLMNYKPLFAGKYREWKGTLSTSSLVEGAKLFWARLYPNPLKNCEVFKEELNRQWRIGVLHEHTAENFFGTPKNKKNDTNRLVINFLQNQPMLEQKEYLQQTI